MKIVSWNVNGIRACLKKGFIKFYEEIDADIFCIQETKMQEGQSDFNFTLEGKYYEYWNSAVKKGYSGTAIFTKNKPLSIKYGLGIEEHDQEGRMITLEYEKFFLVNVYVPNSKSDLSRLDYRMKWEDDFKKYLSKINEYKPVIVCGDLNVAHQEIDLKNPKSNNGNHGFTLEERNKFSDLLDEGFIDIYRIFYPNKTGAYTWWSPMLNLRERNVGWRIDYFIASNRLINNILNVEIFSCIFGSDHCPIGIDLSL